MAHRPHLIARAVTLRIGGIGIPSIARELGIAKSTAARWVRDVSISEGAAQMLVQRSTAGRQRGLARIHEVRQLQDGQRRESARSTVVAIQKGLDVPWWQMIAALLFWCEGSKRNLSSLRFVNSDPAMVRLFLRALWHGFGMRPEAMTAVLHLHEYHDEQCAIAYWSQATGIPAKRFRRSYVKQHTGKRKREDYPGCISVRCGEAKIARMLDALYHAFSGIGA